MKLAMLAFIFGFMISPKSFGALDETDRELYECLSASFFLPEKINDFANSNSSFETTVVGATHNFSVRLPVTLDGSKGTVTYGADDFTFKKNGKKEAVVTGKQNVRNVLEQILDNRSESIVNYISNEPSRDKKDRLKGEVKKALNACDSNAVKQSRNTGKLNEIMSWSSVK